MIPPGNVLLSVLALGILAGIFAGWTARDWKADSDQLAAVLKAEQLRDKLQAKVDAKGADLEAARAEHATAATSTTTQLREIYHEKTVPADCAAPAAAVGVLNRAIDRANAEAAGQSRGALPSAAPATGAADRP